METYRDEVEFHGHPLVRSTHRTTIEVTRDSNLTVRGDCVLGVRADKGPADLSEDVRELIRTDGSQILLTLEVLSESFKVRASGSSLLTLEDAHEMVIRKSDFVSPRTLAIRATAAARDVPRTIVESLRNPDCRGLLRIEVRA